MACFLQAVRVGFVTRGRITKTLSKLTKTLSKLTKTLSNMITQPVITHYFEPADHQLQTFSEHILEMCWGFGFRNVYITCFSDHFYLKVNAEGQIVEVHFISEDKHLPFKLFINGVKFHVADALQFGKIMQAYIDRTI